MGLCMCDSVYGIVYVCDSLYGAVYVCDCMGLYVCVTLYEVVYVYEAGSVCPHAPIRHLNSVSQSPVPPE